MCVVLISTSANTRRRIVIYKYDDSQHPSDWIVNKKEKRNNLSVTGLHLLSRSRLAYRHILIMLSFSDKIRLTTRSISSRLALRVPNRARPFRESPPTMNGEQHRRRSTKSCFRSRKTTWSWKSTSQYRQFCHTSLRSSFVPSMRRFAELSFTHWLVLYVLALKRKDYATPQARVYFLFSVWRMGLTARRQGISGNIGASGALCEGYSCNISLVTGGKQIPISPSDKL